MHNLMFLPVSRLYEDRRTGKTEVKDKETRGLITAIIRPSYLRKGFSFFVLQIMIFDNKTGYKITGIT